MTPFDPYHKWLGIPPKEQPANYYRLLGIEEFEADADVIEGAAERQTIYLRTFQTGPNSELAARLLNEVSAARVCLLDGKSKTLYDAQLRTAQQTAPEEDPLALMTEELAAISSKPVTQSRSRSGKPVWQQPWAISVGAVGIVMVLLLVIVFFGSGEEPKEPANQSTNTTPGNQQKTQPTANNKTLPAKVAVAPFDAAEAKAHQAAWAKYLGVPVEYTNSIGMKFMLIPPGEFMMGPKTSNSTVIISKPFYLGKYEVTKGEYSALIKNGNEQPSKSRLPVTDIHSISAIKYCKLLSSNTGQFYRLPTEAEWEYCCKAGTSTVYHFGEKDNIAGEYAWYEVNSKGVVHEVGQKLGNHWGIFDLHGNCREWCLNFYYEYASGEETDPMGPADGKYRVLRGGSYDSSSPHIRSDWRSKYPTNYVRHMFGFRVVLEIPVRAQPNTSATGAKSLPPSLEQGLVSYYPFNGNANDESGNGHHGTVSGATLTADRMGKFGQAYEFIKANKTERITIPGETLNAASAFTWSAWIRIDAESSRTWANFISGVPNDTNHNEFIIGTLDSKFKIYFKGEYVKGFSVMNWTSDWKHVVVTRSSFESPFRVFVDGFFIEEFVFADTGTPSIDSNGLVLGNEQDSVGGGFTTADAFGGKLDDVRIYNRALSEAEVKSLYEFEKP